MSLEPLRNIVEKIMHTKGFITCPSCLLFTEKALMRCPKCEHVVCTNCLAVDKSDCMFCGLAGLK